MQLRRRNLLGALAAMAAMLFLQAAHAFAACELPGGRAGMAMHAAAMPDCHEAQSPEALCLAHCQAEDQTLGKLQPGLPDIAHPPAALIYIAAAPLRTHAPLPPVVPAAGPPPRILYQSLLL